MLLQQQEQQVCRLVARPSFIRSLITSQQYWPHEGRRPMNLFMVDASGSYWQGDPQTRSSLAKWETGTCLRFRLRVFVAVNRSRGAFGAARTF